MPFIPYDKPTGQPYFENLLGETAEAIALVLERGWYGDRLTAIGSMARAAVQVFVEELKQSTERSDR